MGKVTLNFRDGGLGIVAPGPGGTQAKIGVSLKGTPLTSFTVGTLTALSDALEGGPLCDAAAQVIGVAGTPVICVPCPIVTAGSVGSWTQTGTGAGTVSSAVGPHKEIRVLCSTAGTLGTAAFQFSVGGVAYSTPVVSVAGATWVYRVPGSFVTLTFAAGTYVLAGVHTIATTGVITRTGSATDTVTFVASPVDAYQVKLAVTLGGAVGTAQFTYSLDNGVTVSAPIITASTYVIPRTGIVLSLGSTFVALDTYSATATPPTTDNTNIGLAFDVLQALSTAKELTHVVGTPSSSANAATLAVVADGKMTTDKTVGKYEKTVIECPRSETDSTISAAFAGFESVEGRVIVGAVDTDLLSPLTGLLLKRSGAWALCARIASSRLCEKPSKVALGAVPNVRNIYQDELANPGLAAARFVTMQTRPNKNGYYFSGSPTMASTVSDYSIIPNVRVINRAATIADEAYVDYLDGDVRIDNTTGYVDDRDLVPMDNKVSGMLQDALIGNQGTSNDNASAVSAQMSKTDNLLSTSLGHATINCTPKGYWKNISVSVGFVNPRFNG
jgi:hypothetical protein